MRKTDCVRVRVSFRVMDWFWVSIGVSIRVRDSERICVKIG